MKDFSRDLDAPHFVTDSQFFPPMYILTPGTIICKNGFSFHCNAEDIQLYISAKPDDSRHLNKVEEPSNCLLLNSEKTRPQAVRRKLSDYIVTLDGLYIMYRSKRCLFDF